MSPTQSARARRRRIGNTHGRSAGSPRPLDQRRPRARVGRMRLLVVEPPHPAGATMVILVRCLALPAKYRSSTAPTGRARTVPTALARPAEARTPTRAACSAPTSTRGTSTTGRGRSARRRRRSPSSRRSRAAGRSTASPPRAGARASAADGLLGAVDAGAELARRRRAVRSPAGLPQHRHRPRGAGPLHLRFARSLARFPGTVYLRYAHEMNGYWYPWSRDPAAYRVGVAADRAALRGGGRAQRALRLVGQREPLRAGGAPGGGRRAATGRGAATWTSSARR